MKQKKIFPGRVIFDHIEKTGGQAVNAWLIENLGSGCVTPNLIGFHRDLIRRYGGEFSVISGHILFWEEEGLDPRYQYITALRDPLDRAISWIYFLLNNVEESRETVDLINGARRFLDSEGSDSNERFLLTISDPYVNHFCRITGKENALAEVRLANALRAIGEYDVVGFQEDMPGFLSDVALSIGAASAAKLNRINVTRSRPQVHQLSDVLRERLKALNTLDMEFYARVAESASSRRVSIALNSPALTLWDKAYSLPERSLLTSDVLGARATLLEGNKFSKGSFITLEVDFFLARKISEMQMGIHLFDEDRNWAFGINNVLLGEDYRDVATGCYRLTYHLIADLPVGKYSGGFSIQEKGENGDEVLCWFDKAYEFEVYLSSQNHPGYVSLPCRISLQPSTGTPVGGLISDAKGHIGLLNPPSEIPRGSRAMFRSVVSNESPQPWIGNSVLPLSVAYHWLDSRRNVYFFEGERTAIPGNAVVSGVPTEFDFYVVAPDIPGDYFLMPTLLQEGVIWLEEVGLRSECVAIRVI